VGVGGVSVVVAVAVVVAVVVASVVVAAVVAAVAGLVGGNTMKGAIMPKAKSVRRVRVFKLDLRENQWYENLGGKHPQKWVKIPWEKIEKTNNKITIDN
jgi:hypothetical protein